ncbi:MAG: glycine cleavage system protein GcvH [Myxococcaceae bacterium]|nr:MAG: glycine cleavage system protein GcvH [Myxococcaceae bacterium]
MADVPSGLKYTKEHEWARVEGNRVTVGITQHAVDALGDIILVSVDVKLGATLTAGKVFGVVESTKSVSDLFSPIGGTVVAINEALKDAPEKVNESPYGDGWMVVIETAGTSSDLDGLMDAAAYGAFLGTL